MSSWFPTCLLSTPANNNTSSTSSSSSTSPPDDPDNPLPADFTTSLDTNPRWLLSARASTLRTAASLAFSCISPFPLHSPQNTTTFSLDSTLGPWPGKDAIAVNAWLSGVSEAKRPRPAVINFHGGGFVIGSGTDDRIWTSFVQQELDAVVFSINYRLAPGYPFPQAVHDCVDAIVQIYNKADRLGVDRSAVFLSGFSAGGSLAMAAWLMIQEWEKWKMPVDVQRPVIAGMVLFYPGLDWTVSRAQKRKGCQRPEMTLPVSMTDLFDCSYIFPNLCPEARRDTRLSPGLMADEVMGQLPPVHFCVCEYDMLLTEQEVFVERMRRLGKEVGWRVVKGEKHAWDKPMPVAVKGSVGVEYSMAVDRMRRWLGQTAGEMDAEKEKGAKETMKEVLSREISLVLCNGQ